MRGQFAGSSCREAGFGLALLCGGAPWVARATDATVDAAGTAPHSTLFLFLALGCFGFAGFMLVTRAVTLSRARRRRSNAVRRLWYPDRVVRSRGFLKRWFGRGPGLERLNRWEERTRTAEEKAEQALAVLRSELTPHLAQIMRDRLLITLMSQRARLLSGYEAQAEKVTALESRLAVIQQQVRRQSEAYEQRIVQLEKELQDKGAVTRELLRFRVLLARQALETVRLSPEPARTRER
jgi:hypothetical protein